MFSSRSWETPLLVSVDGSADRYITPSRTILLGWPAMGYPPQSRKLQRPSISIKGGDGRSEFIALNSKWSLERRSAYAAESQLELPRERSSSHSSMLSIFDKQAVLVPVSWVVSHLDQDGSEKRDDMTAIA